MRGIMVGDSPWFVGKDIAENLGYSNTRDAILNHIDSEDKQSIQLSDIQDRRETRPSHMKGSKIVIINESGVYSLIFSSKLPDAKKFKRWVTSEVLPTIISNSVFINLLTPKSVTQNSQHHHFLTFVGFQS